VTVVAYDDGVPEDRRETQVTVYVSRNENKPTFPDSLGPFVISYEVRLGYVITYLNATDSDGVRTWSMFFI